MVGWLDEKAWDSEGYNQVMWVNHKWLWVWAVVVKVKGWGCGPIFPKCLLDSSADSHWFNAFYQ